MKAKIIGILVVTLLILTAFTGFAMEIKLKSIDTDYSNINQVFLKDKVLKGINNPGLSHKFGIMLHKLRTRTYLVYRPTNYDGIDPVPLVLVLHGSSNTAKNASKRFEVSEKAEENGFITVYLDGVCKLPRFRNWNMGFGFGFAYHLKVDDVGFIKKLIKKMQQRFNIDSDKIYIAGHSAGAMMTYRLASELSDVVAAIASNGGTIGGHMKDYPMWQISKPDNPVSIVHFHGKQDYIVPYDGGWNLGGSVYYLSVNDSITFWVEQNGCNIYPETNVSGNVTIDKYTGGDAGTEVWLYTVNNKGHIWFGGQSWEDPNPEISTTDEMWEFFKSHPKQ